ncbi:hypothetical protein pEaSNUABM49_00321 [Erwinia phage pEa_SNUABM_49]|nr:hypothetical protein pEaSNUABM49_00321 [Erwinia phage pEa_SNUABM_49]
MPSKSKAQARFMAAAAHNPAFAKEAGISTKAAKEWNQADEKEGNLKKSSNKPDHIKEEVLDEARGVGILNVPPALIDKVRRYVGSILLTMGLMKQHDLKNQGREQESTALLNYLKRFQQKYNAAVLSPTDLKKYINSISTLNLDSDAIYNQLPENIKKNPKTKELLQNLRMKLRINNQLTDRGGSNQTVGNLNVQEIGIPSYNHDLKNADLDSVVHSMNYSMGTIEHELQHAIQTTVLGKLNPKDQQTHTDPNYRDRINHPDAYYASGIEYGPQVKDLANTANHWLEEHPEDLTGNKNTDISNAIKFAMSKISQGKIIQALRNYKHDDRANKAMKLIYREVSKFYDNDLKNTDDHELDRKEQDVFNDVEDTRRSLEYPEHGDSWMGDMWLAYNEYFGEQPKASGSWDDIQDLRFKRPYGEVDFEKGTTGIHMYVRTNDKDTSFHMELSPKAARMAINYVSYFSTYATLTKLKDILTDEMTPNVDLAKADDIIVYQNNVSETFNDDSNKNIDIQYIEDESTIYVAFNGVRHTMYVQENGKKYMIGYGDDDSSCKSSDFKIVIEMLFEFYYDENNTPRETQRVLRNIVRNGITPDEVESSMRYAKELSKKEPELQESSMRSWVDVVQNAELEHDIDDADEQTLINTDRIDEMPLKYDSFMGMDPQIYVDKEAQKNKPQNMKPINNHGEWTTYRGKNGYMAYDNDTGEALATVEGHEDDGWFNVDVTASSRSVKGVVYQMFMDIIKIEGTPILSGRLQSNDAINFWKRLIQSHKVYVVANGEVIQEATPEKFHKYWSDEEGSPQSQFQFLLVK